MAIMLSASVLAAFPINSVTRPITGEIKWTTVTINWTAAGNNATHFTNYYNVSIANSTTSSITWIGDRNTSIDNTTLSWTDNIIAYPSGYYTYRLRVYANNTGDDSNEFVYTGYSGNFTIDHTAPTSTGCGVISSDLSKYYTTSTLTCACTYSDQYGAGESGSLYWWSRNGGAYVAYPRTYTGPKALGDVFNCTYRPSDGYNFGTDTISGASTALTYTSASSAAVSCTGTKAIIYAGFGLIAVGVIVLAGFLIISLFRGGDGSGAIMGVTIGSVAIGIVVMVGYYLIDVVAVAVCSAAV